MKLRPTVRAGYTLLEVMLASVIAVIMMAGLYVAIDTLLELMDEGRTKVEQSALSRSLFQRISTDLTPSLGPTTPPVSSANPMPTGTAASTSDSTQTVNFSIGVKGESDHVAIFLTRLNKSLTSSTDDGSGSTPAQSDVSRITYFMDATRGLCRQEVLQATSDLVDDVPTAFIDGDDHYKVLAGEVKSFDIQYYDGSNWQTTWDGSTPGPDGKTPQGPPQAMEITITLQLDGSDKVFTYKHTIAFATAAGPSSSSSTPSTSSNTTGP
jgi:prepilin-type N-terminal cleavage/methylation domain-containing protein